MASVQATIPGAGNKKRPKALATGSALVADALDADVDLQSLAVRAACACPISIIVGRCRLLALRIFDHNNILVALIARLE